MLRLIYRLFAFREANSNFRPTEFAGVSQCFSNRSNSSVKSFELFAVQLSVGDTGAVHAFGYDLHVPRVSVRLAVLVHVSENERSRSAQCVGWSPPASEELLKQWDLDWEWCLVELRLFVGGRFSSENVLRLLVCRLRCLQKVYHR